MEKYVSLATLRIFATRSMLRDACPSCRFVRFVRDCYAHVTLRYINLDHFSGKFFSRRKCSVLVLYCFIQVSSCISSLLWIRGIFVSLIYAVFFNECISLLEIL